MSQTVVYQLANADSAAQELHDCLQHALAAASAVESLLLLPLIEDTVRIRLQLDKLIVACNQRGGDE
jgi:hypothetical protein